VEALAESIRAVELHRPTFEETKNRLVALLIERGLNAFEATKLAETWLINDDFLLTNLPGEFDVVVGNPPYVDLPEFSGHLV
jgi:16S rRNA A1518/A1519 N6-dimethyltransferase RsmA/KsgA/DIM1 with predicted DNA glycosylase/AP lyase activity